MRYPSSLTTPLKAMQSVPMEIKLTDFFFDINMKHFDSFLDPPLLVWNSRLRSSAGRFLPGSRKYFREYPPKIEIATYLKDEKESLALIYDTLAHEMIHYWLWIRRLPYGHTPEFISKMKKMGVSRYNSVPRSRPYKHIYHCLTCNKTIPARKKLGTVACKNCCKQYSEGRYDVRFKLVLLPAGPSSDQATPQTPSTHPVELERT